MQDLSSIENLKRLLRKHHLMPKKGLGQNFLINKNVLQKICDSAKINSTETILEIGPGPGALSQCLIQQAKKVVSVEFDSQMAQLLQTNFSNANNFEVINMNALEYCPDFSDYKIVANIPYHITSPLLRHYLLEVKNKPSVVVLLIQDEVAKKITDPKNLSLLSIQVKIFGEPEYLFKVSCKDFYPAPKVDSAVIAVKALSKPLVSKEKMDTFFRTVKIGFSQKRKKLINSFVSGTHRSKEEIEEIFFQANIDPNRRPQTLSIEEWKNL